MVAAGIHLLAVTLLLLTGGAAELRCPGRPGVTDAFSRATAVFSGEAVSKEYRRVDLSASGGVGELEVLAVKFKVKRWWKGGAAREAFLYTSVTRTPGYGISSHAEGFAFTKGESYLVYAYGPPDRLRTNACTRTSLLARAGEDLHALGEGSAPKGGRE
jgi:hypothetical protein